ncbi:DoxX family protein [Nocardia sp. NPDC059240]|uniref:DoxX family protein n=1 Tax=Nocardia sp. NPDC059240 TaxID=3346786 RepID=UPI0036A2E8DE
MVAELVVQATEETDETSEQRWNPLLRMVFRYGFVVLGVGMAGVLVFHALLRSLGVPTQTVLDVAEWTSLHPLTDWIGEHVFGTRVSWAATGSGDTAANWVSAFTWLLIAVPITAVWSVLDRARPNYARLYGWFRLILRFALVGALLLYGMTKLLPSQMAFSLERLVEPFGDMSPMAVLWSQTASSQPYEMALGAAEVTAGLLLILPITAGVGAVLAVVVAAQVFLLNLTFDVLVKLFAFQLLVYAVVLAAPDIVRILRALIGRAVPVRKPEGLVTGVRAHRILLAAQVLIGVWLLGTTVSEGHDAWAHYGDGRPHSALYGIWDVTDYSGNPGDRLRRIIFDLPQAVTTQRPDDALQDLPVLIDTDRHTITITRDPAHLWPIATLTYEQPDTDHLILDGRLSGRPVRMTLTRRDLDRFQLVSRGFHWVQPVPYLR